MAEGRSREAWNRASAAMALLANIHRDPKKRRAFRPGDFNPYETADRRPGGIRLTKENIGLLKQVFVKGKACLEHSRKEKKA